MFCEKTRGGTLLLFPRILKHTLGSFLCKRSRGGVFAMELRKGKIIIWFDLQTKFREVPFFLSLFLPFYLGELSPQQSQQAVIKSCDVPWPLNKRRSRSRFNRVMRTAQGHTRILLYGVNRSWSKKSDPTRRLSDESVLLRDATNGKTKDIENRKMSL